LLRAGFAVLRTSLATVAAAGPLAGCMAPCDYGQGNSLPANRVDSLPIVPVELNDHRVPFVFDTGAALTTLLPEGVKALGLQTDLLRSSRGVGIGGETQSSNALLARLRVGTQDVRNLTLPVASHTMGEGRRVPAGLLGADFLRASEIDLNLPENRVVLYDRRRCLAGEPPWSGAYDTVPLQVLPNGWLRLQVRLNGQALPAILDTGASSTLVSPDTARSVGVPEKVLSGPAAGKALGLGTEQLELRTWQGASLQVGEERLDGLTLAIAPLPAEASFKVLLGQDYIASRRLWISYATQRLYVQWPSTPPRHP